MDLRSRSYSRLTYMDIVVGNILVRILDNKCFGIGHLCIDIAVFDVPLFASLLDDTVEEHYTVLSIL